MYCMYIYNRVICMDFPETHIWIIYGIVFFKQPYFPHSLPVFFFQDQKEELSQHKGDWESTASGARLRWICFLGLRPEVSAVSTRPGCARVSGPEDLPNNGCHVFMVNVGKHTVDGRNPAPVGM